MQKSGLFFLIVCSCLAGCASTQLGTFGEGGTITVDSKEGEFVFF